MLVRVCVALLSIVLLFHGCSERAVRLLEGSPSKLKFRAAGSEPEVLAIYEAWFGLPQHIAISYNSHDPAVIRKQIQEAKARGIHAFVVDWYGDREPFIDRSYQLIQTIAAEENFHVAMIYDETNHQDGATDETLADLTMFHDAYLSAKAPGHEAYLTYDGRPVIFVFPTQGHTHWDRVRAIIDKWSPKPLLIDEFLPQDYVSSFDGFYAWINPGPKGWAPDGSHWGKDYLDYFYRTMRTKYPDKIIVGGAWASFNDSRASWSLNRHISARCGQTFTDTFHLWKRYFPADDPIPYVMVQTWNDYEEGTEIEPGLPTCTGPSKRALTF